MTTFVMFKRVHEPLFEDLVARIPVMGSSRCFMVDEELLTTEYVEPKLLAELKPHYAGELEG